MAGVNSQICGNSHLGANTHPVSEIKAWFSKVASLEMSECVSLTIHRCEDDPGVVVGYNICIAVLWLVDLQVGVLPGELLSWINRLTHRGREWEGERAGKHLLQ